MARLTISAADPMREGTAIFASQCAESLPEPEREIGIASPAPVCRIVRPMTICKMIMPWSLPATVAGSIAGPVQRRYACFHPGEVTSAIVIVRQKTICARLAWAIEIGSGRYQSTVMPPRMPCVITAASAM